jgi:adenosylcobyric acid synthase
MGERLARTVMVQGTASDVGKSILVTALCRILRQDGYRVAPFKSQNMALNAAVTIDDGANGGGEIGRSQAEQARAAGIEPTVDMNPILLKPEAGMRSQVIVRGKVWRTLPWREYYRHRDELLAVVEHSLMTLRREYDVVVIEGAGSPAEINLRAGDIVNMRIAALADAPVLLVGDIDRGGVFASLLGTVELLEPDERARVKGLVINKFRGDPSLLGSGLDFIAARTGVPVLGLIPHLPGIGIAAEDSVVLDHPVAYEGTPLLDIAVIHLPRMSNFDDFDPLAAEPGVRVRFVRDAAALGAPDLLILPGTMTTIPDLLALRERGLDRAIVALARGGTPTLGICGGLQLLGEAITDPHRIESDVSTVAGLGLLPLRTTFAATKRTERARGTVDADWGLFAGAAGLDAVGYEIHLGETSGAVSPLLRLAERQGRAIDEPDGAIDDEGWIAGTYLHGFFDSPPLRGIILRNLAARKGIAPHPDWGRAPRHDPFDRLAARVREHLDMAQLRAIIGL